MRVPFVDLRVQYQSIKVEIDDAIGSVINDSAFIGGKYVDQFADSFADLYGMKHCIPCGNGTDSLYIILRMLGIGRGDEVITVANSWISSSETISQTGATPVFVDIDPDYYSIDERQIESAITSSTKCIMPVHLHGQMCEMDTIIDISKKYNIPILEDCAQAHFSEYKGRRAGTLGIAGSFSFFPGKNLGAYGDAGGIVTNDDELATNCIRFARHGALKKHHHEIEGINSRLDGLQAAILTVKLNYILDWTENRRKAANKYKEFLKNQEHVVLPKERSYSKHSYHLFVIRAERRDELAAYLKTKNIETSIHYPQALPNMKAYAYLNYTRDDFPVASGYEDKILSLPIFPEITNSQIEYVVENINAFYK